MLAVLKAYRATLACLAAALAIGVVAIVDHDAKRGRLNRAEIDEYFCRVYGERCGGTSSRRIEDRWNARQLGYEIAVGTLAAVGLGLACYRISRRPTRSSWRSGR